jgi:bifunctional DNA-binding transcriptional regulator/antitoxin component of YhaV-PrlF toxin-antitoxin module
MSKETREEAVIALATVYQDGTSVRGKIPASVVKALRAKDGDVLAFERRSDGRVLVRKSNAAERKGLASKKGGKK